jgi:putative endonuclease
MKSDHERSLGNKGEELAANFLIEQAYSILDKNFRTPYGEIDLITKTGDVIAFVEVKTRLSTSLGPPEISVTTRKQEHMRSAAEYYIQQHPELKNDWRIDVIAIQMRPGNNPPIIVHFENALS